VSEPNEPMDRYNEELLSNVAPADWKNPDPKAKYHLVVIGAGSAGLVTAAGAAGLGAKVALVEKYRLGGDCLNYGCVPSKSLLRAAHAAADVRDADRFGVRVPEGATVDFPTVMERMRRIRARISEHDSAERFSDLGVDVFLGEARFADSNTVEVGDQDLRFRKAVIASGARAVRPPVEGIEETGYLTNETVFDLTELPPRLAVFGAGPLGCEMAQAFRRFGSEVTIVERRDHLLSREDSDAAAIVAEAFRKDGIRVCECTEVKKMSRTDEGKLLEMEVNGERENLTVDEVLIGAGRAPNVEGLNLEGVDVEYDARKGVHVDDRLRTTNSNIFAAGDICLKYKFTHTADFSARIVLRNALFWGRSKLSALTIPWCTYTDPEIAHVGMYEKDAEERGIPVQTFVKSLAEVDRAIADGEENGFVKIHVKKGTDKILGATIVARHAGEMIGEIGVAMAGKVGLGKLANVIHPYPTQAEAIRLTGDLYNRTRLTGFVKWLFEKVLSWQV